jgi:hypothetical protein
LDTTPKNGTLKKRHPIWAFYVIARYITAEEDELGQREENSIGSFVL